jgi:hypothetical protein
MLQVDIGTIDVFTAQNGGQKIGSVSVERNSTTGSFTETWVVQANLGFPLSGSFWARRVGAAPTALAALKAGVPGQQRVYVVRAEVTHITAEV